jgi:hypothetical protein
VPLLSFEYTTPELTHKLSPILNKLKTIGLYRFNYSIGESMHFELDEWASVEESFEIVKTSKFLCTGFGDIYIRYY